MYRKCKFVDGSSGLILESMDDKGEHTYDHIRNNPHIYDIDCIRVDSPWIGRFEAYELSKKPTTLCLFATLTNGSIVYATLNNKSIGMVKVLAIYNPITGEWNSREIELVISYDFLRKVDKIPPFFTKANLSKDILIKAFYK